MSQESASKTLHVIAAIASLMLASALILVIVPNSAFAAKASKYEPTAEDVQLAKSEPKAENSYRYSNGKLIEDADTSGPAPGVGLFSLVKDKNGRKFFNSFDTYKKGYCTGQGAFKGIDVSQYQSTINWAKVKNAGVDFAIIRCGYGSNYRSQDDTMWLTNVQGCIQNRIPFGIYIYSYAKNSTQAKSEGRHVLRCLEEAGLGPSDLAYPIYLDIEDESTMGCNYANITKAFCNVVQGEGFPVGVYASTFWWENYLTSSVFNNYHKWIAQWNVDIGLTYTGASNFSSGNGTWQFSSYGKVSGITGRVDLNYTYVPPNAVELMDDKYTAPTTPYAKTIENGEYIIYSHAKTTMTATVKDGSADDNANIHLSSSDMTGKQRFNFVRNSSTGFYTISNSSNGKVFGLAKSGNIYLSNLAQRGPNTADNSQKWIVSKSSTNKYVIKNAANPSFVMKLSNASASAGSNIQVGAWKGGNSQKWGLASTKVSVGKSTAKIKTGVYTLALSKHTGRAVEVTNGSASHGANIQLNTVDKSAKQKFLIEDDGDGYYHIRSLISGKAIEPTIGNLVPKTNVRLVSYSPGSLSQKWSVSKSGSKYTFTSAANGHVLEVASGSTKAKANVQTNHLGATTSQAFVLKTTKAAKTVSNGIHKIRTSKDVAMGIGIKSNSKSDRAKARLTKWAKSKSAKFSFYYDKSTGFYTIKNIRSGKYLEITGLKCASGKTIRQATKSNSYAQRWIVAKVSKGKYLIKSALNPEYVLDAGKSKIKNNAYIKLYKRDTSRIQVWKL